MSSLTDTTGFMSPHNCGGEVTGAVAFGAEGEQEVTTAPSRMNRAHRPTPKPFFRMFCPSSREFNGRLPFGTAIGLADDCASPQDEFVAAALR
jgi:hypothetical protein